MLHNCIPEDNFGIGSKHVPVTMLDVRLDGIGNTSFTQELPAGDEGFVYVLSGKGQFSSDGTSVGAGQVGHLAHTNVIDGPTRMDVTAKEPMRFLLWTGRPTRQPVVAHGPFVMNTENQIAEAFSDYRAWTIWFHTYSKYIKFKGFLGD
jgi:quercetin 2,3-dioxygenase